MGQTPKYNVNIETRPFFGNNLEPSQVKLKKEDIWLE